jgi:lysozyme family protein
MSKDFEAAFLLAMKAEVGEFFNPNLEVHVRGTILNRKDEVQTGYVNDPDDAGGETKYGIAKNFNPGIDIRNLTLQSSKKIYESKYWNSSLAPKLPYPLSVVYFDAAINNGATPAAKFIQRALGVVDDGQIGPKTLAAIAACTDLKALCVKSLEKRDDYFRAIVANKPVQAKYLRGWLNRTARVRKWLQQA